MEKRINDRGGSPVMIPPLTMEPGAMGVRKDATPTTAEAPRMYAT
jgi:hypothetical protein